MTGSNTENSDEDQNRFVDHLKKFGSRTKEQLKKFGIRAKEQLKKFADSSKSGYSITIEDLNKFAAFITIGLGVAAYFIHTAFMVTIFPSAWGSNLWILILPIIGGVLYFFFVKKQVEERNFEKKTQIFLIVSTGLSCAALFWPGVPIFIIFVKICIRSDVPFWKVLTESQAKPQTKPRVKIQSKSSVQSQTK